MRYEFLNNKFDHFSELDDWSESVNKSIFDYDRYLKNYTQSMVG